MSTVGSLCFLRGISCLLLTAMAASAQVAEKFVLYAPHEPALDLKWHGTTFLSAGLIVYNGFRERALLLRDICNET